MLLKECDHWIWLLKKLDWDKGNIDKNVHLECVQAHHFSVHKVAGCIISEIYIEALFHKTLKVNIMRKAEHRGLNSTQIDC